MTIPMGVRVGLVIFGALLFQLSVLNRIEMAGVSGNLLVVVAVVGGFTAGAERGAVIGFAVGLSFDLLLTTPLGLTALVYTAAGYVSGLISTSLIRSSRSAVVVLATVAAPVCTLAWVVIGALFGQTHLFDGPLLNIALISAAVAFVAVWPMLPLMRWATADPHDRVRHYV